MIFVIFVLVRIPLGGGILCLYALVVLIKIERFLRLFADHYYMHRNLILTVKHGGGAIMIWACFAPTEPDHLVMNSVYSVRPSAWQLKLGHNLGHATGQ